MKATKIVAMVLICVLLLGMTSYASEIEENEYGEPNLSRWSYTFSSSVGMSINSSGTATMNATVTGYSDKTTKIVIYFYLQQYDAEHDTWKNITTYRDETAGWYTAKEHTYTVESGYTYRLRCIFYVYGPDQYHYDYFTGYSAQKNY